jgi:hypothetical protein
MFKFRVIAYNFGCVGQTSSVLRLPIFDKPIMPCATITTHKCLALVSWPSPSNQRTFGGKVEQYRINVKGRDNRWYEFD